MAIKVLRNEEARLVIDPCPFCRAAAEVEARNRVEPPLGLVGALKAVKKGSCEQWALYCLSRPVQIDESQYWIRKHARCKGCFMLFGPGHEAVLTDRKKGFCQRCVLDFFHYGPQAFTSGT